MRRKKWKMQSVTLMPMSLLSFVPRIEYRFYDNYGSARHAYSGAGSLGSVYADGNFHVFSCSFDIGEKSYAVTTEYEFMEFVVYVDTQIYTSQYEIGLFRSKSLLRNTVMSAIGEVERDDAVKFDMSVALRSQ